MKEHRRSAIPKDISVIMANVLQTKVDGQCIKLATELSWQRLRRLTFFSYSELLVESCQFNLPHLHFAPPLGWPQCLRDPTFSCFSRTLTCDRQTHYYSIYHASMASHGKSEKKINKNNYWMLKANFKKISLGGWPPLTPQINCLSITGNHSGITRQTVHCLNVAYQTYSLNKLMRTAYHKQYHIQEEVQTFPREWT